MGIGIVISFAFIINCFGISGLTPIKGMAVPFLSYGGSSLIALSIAMGMILSISKRVKY
jgi:cell division protein FtsW